MSSFLSGIGMGDVSMAQSAMSEASTTAARRAVEYAAKDTDNTDKMSKLRAACEDFEALFIQKIWKGMRDTLPKDGLMHSKEEEFWQDMYDKELGKSMASSGGIGLSDMMMSQLSRQLQDASELAAGSRRRPMAIEPAPLLPKAAPLLAEQPEKQHIAAVNDTTLVKHTAVMADDMYSGEAAQATDAENVTGTQTTPVNPDVNPLTTNASSAQDQNPHVSAALHKVEQQVSAQQATREPLWSVQRSSADLAAGDSKRSDIPRVRSDNPIVTGRYSENNDTTPQPAQTPKIYPPTRPVSETTQGDNTFERPNTTDNPQTLGTLPSPLEQLRAQRRNQAAEYAATQRRNNGSEIARNENMQTAMAETGQNLPDSSRQNLNAVDLLKAQFGN